MMTDFLPLFPLKMVVFPGESVNLHVFEPRYKQMIRECNANKTTFGIPAYISSKMMEFGTEIELLEIQNVHDNGELDIKTRGIGIFKISEFYNVTPQKLYAGADIERLKETDERDPMLNSHILQDLEELFQLLGVQKKLPTHPDSFISFEMAHHVGFSLEQEYEFLCLNSEKARQEYIYGHLERLIPVVKEMERLRQKVQLNGHFKNAIPPGE